jgi:hypothetical protein
MLGEGTFLSYGLRLNRSFNEDEFTEFSLLSGRNFMGSVFACFGEGLVLKTFMK